MNLNDILGECVQVPGISLKENSNSIELCMEQQAGKGSMTFFSVFPGVSLSYIFINSPTWPMPDLPQANSTPLVLNYCILGSCEIVLDNSKFLYLKNGEVYISQKSVTEQYSYPLGTYEGIEILIDIDEVLENASYINDVFHVDIYKFMNIYCSLNEPYISQCTEDINQLFLKLWKLYNEDSSHSKFMMQIFTLQLLELLLCKEDTVTYKPPTFFTATQVKIAQKTENIITKDLKVHHPAWKLAEMFSISETSLKNYFRGVYGKNISIYLREARMNAAANMLESTKLPISKIAEQVGYMNQSKFASVFKLQFDMSPLEYRRKKALELQNEAKSC